MRLKIEMVLQQSTVMRAMLIGSALALSLFLTAVAIATWIGNVRDLAAGTTFRDLGGTREGFVTSPAQLVGWTIASVAGLAVTSLLVRALFRRRAV